MPFYYIACVPQHLEVRNPLLVATAQAPSYLAREPQVKTINRTLFDSADETMLAECRGVMGVWVTPVLFIPPCALCDNHADALAILECESAGR